MSRGTQHVIGTVSNEATNDMGYQSWPLWRTCYLIVDDTVILLKHWSWGLVSFSQAVCFTIMQNGTSSFMTSAHDALVLVQVCASKTFPKRETWHSLIIQTLIYHKNQVNVGTWKNLLLLISINFTPETRHSCLKIMVHYVFQVNRNRFECLGKRIVLTTIRNGIPRWYGTCTQHSSPSRFCWDARFEGCATWWPLPRWRPKKKGRHTAVN